ncbi:phosphotransferase family protein [Cellulomonas edaphi]|uniref:Aminoglycoside phosphotransferase family protein n=1 Tax=Cellulomonas edaphi TaxID=3053468 RepID=A0ABT7S5F8_9CELL|nr:aminoglycoside phosphotransferase family protein [Cellulomons edaphi]MDM7830287.1 aminoglycoside phosphotransferase family protein [Cellulomons edaphi]
MTSSDTLSALVAPVGRLTGFERLTGGMFATTYRVTLEDGSRVVVKTAPTDLDRLLTYELDLLRTEALVYELAHERPELLMPTVLHTDYTRTVLPSDVLVVSHLPGTPMLDAGLGADDPRTERLERDLGAYLAHQHTLTGTRFGYPNAETGLQADAWPEAFSLIVEALLADAARWGTALPDDEIRAALRRHAGALAHVTTPVLVHTDLWPGNLFVDPATGELLGVIDTERAMWGDPLLDLVGIDPMWHGVSPRVLAGYGATSGAAWDVEEPDAAARLLLYRLLMALIMKVETAPRAYEGDWVADFVARYEENLARALTALA